MNEILFLNLDKYASVGGWSLFVALCLFVVTRVLRGKLMSDTAHNRELEALTLSHKNAMDALKETHLAAYSTLRSNSDREITSLREGLTAALAANHELFAQQAKLVTGFSVVHKTMEAIAPRDSTNEQ